MSVAIPADVVLGSAKPEIGAQIHDATGQGTELLNPFDRAPVRQAQEEQIHALNSLGSHEFERCPAPQVRVREMDELAVEPFAGDLANVDVRVGQQQPQ